MFSLKTAAGVFAQLAAEEPFGLVMFNIVIAPMAAPAVGLAKFVPAAGRIKRTAELGNIDEGFDHQHRMAVTSLPIGGKAIEGQAQHLLARLGTERSGRIRKRLLLVTRLRRRWRCAALHPIHWSRCLRCLAGALRVDHNEN